MKLNVVLVLLALTLSACAAPVKPKPELVPDRTVVPEFPKAPVPFLDQPLGPQMVPEIECLQMTGRPLCRGDGSSTERSNVTPTA